MSVAEAQAAALAVRSQLAEEGYESAIERWSLALSPLCSSRDRSRLRRLCILGASCDSTGGIRPSDLADRIEDERVEEPTASSVRVMTIHKSKGLEFDIVVLPDLDESLYDMPKVCVGSPAPAERPETVLIAPDKLRRELLPPELARAFDQQRRMDVQESLCCLYVAMTRAVHGLYMVIAPQAKTKAVTRPATRRRRACSAQRWEASTRISRRPMCFMSTALPAGTKSCGRPQSHPPAARRSCRQLQSS